MEKIILDTYKMSKAPMWIDAKNSNIMIDLSRLNTSELRQIMLELPDTVDMANAKILTDIEVPTPSGNSYKIDKQLEKERKRLERKHGHK